MTEPSNYQRRLREHYAPLIGQHGGTYRAVDWGSQRSQLIRFQVILQTADLANASILDVGCGVGHLAGVLAEAGHSGEYLGIDVVPEMVAAARQHHPGRNFEVADVLEPGGLERVDYVVGSGLFTFADAEIMRQTIGAMYALCDEGTIFNSLSSWANDTEEGELNVDPLQCVSDCSKLTPWVTLRHDYMPHDFTIALFRAARRA